MSDEYTTGEYQIEHITCPSCQFSQANVISHLLDIPYYKDFIMININCPDCGFRTSDFMNLQDKDHVIYRYPVTDIQDDSTKVVRSREGIVSIPELGIKIEPAGDASTWIRNIEGILDDMYDKLLITLKYSETKAEKSIIRKRMNLLKDLKHYKQPFTIEVEDISGNSVILPADEKKLEKIVVETLDEKLRRQEQENDQH